MGKGANLVSGTTWFLSAPEISTLARRGDPLGLRNITNEAADLLAPGLTNRTIDARWLSLLSWALVHSERAWRKAGGSSLRTAHERALRYDWLRPLELLWVKRSMHLGGEEYKALHWPGSRSLRRWDGAHPDFGMTDRQRKNHRQLGAYGAYRVLLRTARFTRTGDGWTADEHAKRLATHVDAQLERDGALPRPARRSSAEPAVWWLRNGWHAWSRGVTKTPFILSSSARIKKLVGDERQVLSTALFDDEARVRCADAVGNSKARDYVSLCRELAVTIPANGGDARLRSLGLLAALSDAGVGVLREASSVIATGEECLDRIARNHAVVRALDAFESASKAWTTARHKKSFQFAAEANRLAAVANARGRTTLLSRFVDHHWQHATGVPWLAPGEGTLHLDGARTGALAGGFSYRLHALSNLAFQCGLINHVPPALRDMEQQIDSENGA